MPSYLGFSSLVSRYHGHGPAFPAPSILVDQSSSRTSWRPPCAINNQHSHIEEELVRMQSQLLVQSPQTSYHFKAKALQHHVYYGNEREPHVHVHHDGHASTRTVDMASVIELSQQYSNNIVNYHIEATPVAKGFARRARVLDYGHPSLLTRDLMMSLVNGGKMFLELPDEPAAVSSLMTALGRTAAKLRAIGLATALDPVHDAAALATCYHGSNVSSHTHTSSGHANSHHHHHHRSGSSGTGLSSSSPSYSYDALNCGSAAARRPHDPSCGGVFLFCARAVPMPSPTRPLAANSAEPASQTSTYMVGSHMGQEVLSVNPSVGVHTLLPALLRAILRDGLVTLRCCWFDEEIDHESWMEDHDASGGLGTSAARNGSGLSTSSSEGCEDHEGCDTSVLWGSGSAGRSWSHDGGIGSNGAAAGAAAAAAASAGSLVRVPCVIRALFKLDWQLRGLDLGGLVVLPHTFSRSCRDSRTQVLYLDVVIA